MENQWCLMFGVGLYLGKHALCHDLDCILFMLSGFSRWLEIEWGYEDFL